MNPSTETNLYDLLQTLWRARKAIVLGVIFGFIASGAFMMLAVSKYRAQMIISPANPMNGAEVSSLLADDNLFAIRYLVQRVGVANSADFMRFETTYAGPSVAELLLKDPSIPLGLSKDKSFIFASGQSRWSAVELADYVARNISIENVGTTTMKRMSYKHPDPEFAKYFLQSVHRITDELIRVKLGQQASAHIRYLENQIDSVQNPEHRRALTSMLMDQERLKMLVSIESPYAASVIEPAASSPRALWPNAKLVTSVFVLVGAMMGFAFNGVMQNRQQFAAKETQSINNQAQQKRSARKKYGYWYWLDHKNANQDPKTAMLKKKDTDAG